MLGIDQGKGSSMSRIFKVMFVFVNDRMRTMIPLNISYLSAALKYAGFETCIFDTSFYKEHERIMDEKKKEYAGVFQPIDYESIGLRLNDGNLIEEFIDAIETEKPNLIGFSAYSLAKELNYNLANAVKEKFSHIPTIFGGIHTNIEPEDVLSRPYVDFICLGEGEKAIVELSEKLKQGKNIEHIENIGFKSNGKSHINLCRPPQDLDMSIQPDWDIFAPHHIYGPFRGKLLRMAIVEYSRTCPYNCSYCGNQIFKEVYKKSGHHIKYRHKSPKHWINELKYMKNRYDIEFVNIPDSTFVAQSENALAELAPMYAKEIGLPFFCDSTVFCLTPKKAKLLKEMGCICINMGIECASEEYRRRYLGRRMSNDRIVESFLMARDAGLETRAYNIIGLPYDTYENIMETIELNRKCKTGSVSLNIFVPYEGTKLRELCIHDGLFDPNIDIIGDGTYPIIKNPDLSDEELMELYNTFSLFVVAPRELFPVIKLSGPDTSFGRRLRNELLAMYT